MSKIIIKLLIVGGNNIRDVGQVSVTIWLVSLFDEIIFLMMMTMKVMILELDLRGRKING